MKYLKIYEDFIEKDNPHGGEWNFGDLSKDKIDRIKSFVVYLEKYCKEKNIKLKLVNEQGVPYGDSKSLVNGYFDGEGYFGEGSVLACSMGKDVKYWFPVLMHESSHMDQYIENDPTWVNNLGLEQTDNWINGDDTVDLNIISEEIRTSMDIEIDCEKRTIEKIKKFELEDILDIDEYIQKSNAYILFYLWMKKHRKWYTIGKEPYAIPEIYKNMSKTFNIDYTYLSDNLESLFNKYL